jgi:hypothetical protein
MSTPWFAMGPAEAAAGPGSTGPADSDRIASILLVVLMLLGVAVTAAWIRVGHSPA